MTVHRFLSFSPFFLPVFFLTGLTCAFDYSSYSCLSFHKKHLLSFSPTQRLDRAMGGGKKRRSSAQTTSGSNPLSDANGRRKSKQNSLDPKQIKPSKPTVSPRPRGQGTRSVARFTLLLAVLTLHYAAFILHYTVPILHYAVLLLHYVSVVPFVADHLPPTWFSHSFSCGHV